MTIQHFLYFLVVALGLQNPNAPSPEETAKMQAQNNELRAIVQKAQKLPWELTPMKLQDHAPDALAGVVSWVASDRNGLIYLIQRGDKLDPVIVMDRNGKVVHSWGKGMYTMPHAIRVDPQGNVWTTDAASSMVYKFSPEGKKLMEIEVGGQPNPCPGNFCSTTDVAFAPNGNLFISDGYRNARVLEYTAQGKKVREWGTAGTGPGQFRLPHSIQVDDAGIIYVADRENGRIQKFDLQGKYLGEWSQYGKTFGLKLDKDAIWLSSIPRGPNGTPGWLFKLDRKTGNLLGYVDSIANHGMDVLPNGEVVSASPARGEMPQWFHVRR
jgi:DNA-binding beta-propeller fold protein YncE